MNKIISLSLIAVIAILSTSLPAHANSDTSSYGQKFSKAESGERKYNFEKHKEKRKKRAEKMLSKICDNNIKDKFDKLDNTTKELLIRHKKERCDLATRHHKEREEHFSSMKKD